MGKLISMVGEPMPGDLKWDLPFTISISNQQQGLSDAINPDADEVSIITSCIDIRKGVTTLIVDSRSDAIGWSTNSFTSS
jgi:hypothetical protein